MHISISVTVKKDRYALIRDAISQEVEVEVDKAGDKWIQNSAGSMAYLVVDMIRHVLALYLEEYKPE